MLAIDISNSHLCLNRLYPISQIAWPFACKVISSLAELDHNDRRAMHFAPSTARIATLLTVSAVSEEKGLL